MFKAIEIEIRKEQFIRLGGSAIDGRLVRLGRLRLTIWQTHMAKLRSTFCNKG